MIRIIVLVVCCTVGFHSEAAPWGGVVKTARKAAEAAKKAVQLSKAASKAKKAEQASKAASEAKKAEQIGKANELSEETAVAVDKNGSKSAQEGIGAVDDFIRQLKKKLENDDDGRNKASKPKQNRVSRSGDIIIPILSGAAFIFVVGALWIYLRRRKGKSK